MKLSMNMEYLVTRLGNEKAASLVAEAGFDCVDYSLMDMINGDCVYNGPDYIAEAQKVGRIFRDHGVPVRQAHAPFRFKDYEDPVAFRDHIFPTIARSVEAAAAMGAPIIVVHPLHYTDTSTPDEIFQRNMKFYNDLLPVCKACGIQVAVENMFRRDQRRGHIIHDSCSRAEEFCRYVDALDKEYFVACLDVGHVGLPVQEDEAWDFVYKLGHDRLKSLHIHDNDYKNDQHGVPYSGKIDWDKVTKALGQIDYTGDFTYEISMTGVIGQMDPELYPAALRYIHDIGRALVAKTEEYRVKSE